MRCVRGSVFDVAVDMRADSDNYLRWFGAELSQGNGTMLLIPPGFAHGYQTLEDETEIFYLTSQFYEPGAATGARFDDPRIGIDWPEHVTVISDADRSWPFVDAARNANTVGEAG